ncbi:hypothetical protein BS17DRAFT_213031 [Gyrodon lividus]|nr:hypothetical protein BS17DRAFT_213031 [Gyrodon lividus]
MSSHLWFLFFLLALIPVALCAKAIRGAGTRTVARITRVLHVYLYLRIGALEKAPTAYEGLKRTFFTMEPFILQRDEANRREALMHASDPTIEQFLVPRIDFATFIRCVSFRIFLVVFLKLDGDVLTSEDVQGVTEALYEFYEDAEATSTLPSEMQNILERWIPTDRFPDPLDRILPAYEALWRIIAATVVHCEDDEDRVLRGVMLDFRDNPRDRQYKTPYYGSEDRSVSTIIEEVVGQLPPIARTSRPITWKWPFGCILLTLSHLTAKNLPAPQEALKLAALMASKVIGQVVGVKYRLSGASNHQGHPWDGREISQVDGRGGD